MKELINEIKRDFSITKTDQRRANQVFVTVSKTMAPKLITWLRDYHEFAHLAFITAVDFPEKNLFQLTYMLHNYEKHVDMGIRVEIDRKNPEMTSMHHLWEQVGTYQRELREMFGIDFPGSPRLHENFALEGWNNKPPMRRDFDTKEYSNNTYFPRPRPQSLDPRKHMKEKLYPTDKGGE